MQVSEGKINRVFVLRLEDGEQLTDCVEQLARDREIGSALVLLVGGARDGALVVGPEHTTLSKPEPMIEKFSEAREILGVGTIFASDEGPKLHLHASCGRGTETLTGCTRLGVHAFLVAEIVILEITGLKASRKPDAISGFNLLNLE